MVKLMTAATESQPNSSENGTPVSRGAASAKMRRRARPYATAAAARTKSITPALGTISS